MTRLAALRRTIELCDERLEAELAGAEIMLLDLGGTTEESSGCDRTRRLFPRNALRKPKRADQRGGAVAHAQR
jgi:hypothetical protein